MPRKPDSGQIDLAKVFHRVQQQMLADLSVSGMFEHASSAGAAAEHHWIRLFERYLPQRYRAAPTFVIDADGRRSRQIDLAIFDNLYAPLLFPHEAGLHIPAESVYAVFEIKPTISKQWLRDAAEKAASVRALRRTSAPIIASGALRRAPVRPQPILAGLLATSSVWSAETFADNIRNALEMGDCPKLPVTPRKHVNRPSGRTVPNFQPAGTGSARPQRRSARGPSSLSPPPVSQSQLRGDLSRIDLGCSLQHGAFELVDHAENPRQNAARDNVVGQAGSLRPVGNRPFRAMPAPHLNPAPGIHISTPDESLIFFMLRLLDRLRAMGTSPAADLMEYGKSLRSLRR